LELGEGANKEVTVVCRPPSVTAITFASFSAHESAITVRSTMNLEPCVVALQ
jgi:hypothetical protein